MKRLARGDLTRASVHAPLGCAVEFDIARKVIRNHEESRHGLHLVLRERYFIDASELQTNRDK
jgi:hypothetical protein